MDLLTTYTHDTELQPLTTLSLIHTLHFTRAQVKSSQSAFTSLFLITNLNNVNPLTSVPTALLPGEYLTTELSTELQGEIFSASLAELNSTYLL
jgi:hypothetical protein